MRNGEIKRVTAETSIEVRLTIDGEGKSKISTGIGFFDHMLTLFSKHGLFDLEINAVGDLNVDDHHTIEDVGIALGQAFKRALGDCAGIRRYGCVHLPMDEALVRAVADVSGRAYLVYDVETRDTAYDVYLEFWRAFVMNGGITLHIGLLYGFNGHHIIEGSFKAAARALREALEADGREQGVPSTKRVL